MTDFQAVWQYLQLHLKPGTSIPNWTVLKGYLGDQMTVTDLDEKSISVEAPNAKNIQVVPVKDFQTVWNHWPDYKSEKLKRVELITMTRYSKYILSIFYWYEQETSHARP